MFTAKIDRCSSTALDQCFLIVNRKRQQGMNDFHYPGLNTLSLYAKLPMYRPIYQ